MKAIKCDRCGSYEIYGHKLDGELSISAVVPVSKYAASGSSPVGGYDLCGQCAKQFSDWIQTWWPVRGEA